MSTLADDMLDKGVWDESKSTPSKMIWYAALGIMLEGLLLGSIGMQALRYLSGFWELDPLWVLACVILGTLLCFVQIAINAWQVHGIVEHAFYDATAFVARDMKANMAVVLWVGVMNAAAATFFGRRAWLLAGRPRWPVPLFYLVLLTTTALNLAVVVQGFSMPELDIQASRAMSDWLDGIDKTVVAWTIVSLVLDMTICGTMTIYLLRTKSALQATEGRLFRKLLMLTFETMLPPVIIVLVQMCIVVAQGSTFANLSRVVLWVIGPAYFHSILYSLVARKDFRDVLAERGSRDSSRIQVHHTRTVEPALPLTPIERDAFSRFGDNKRRSPERTDSVDALEIELGARTGV